MEKSAKDEKTVPAEAAASPKLVFSDDALVVDYLNALLISSPAATIDSSEIQFVHLATGNALRPAGLNNGVVNSSLYYENDQSRVEADLLRSENEKLRFKSELAKIDVQVLRSENNNLKAEVADMRAQLHEIKNAFESILIENDDLKLMLDKTRDQIDMMTKAAEVAELEEELNVSEYQAATAEIDSCTNTEQNEALDDEVLISADDTQCPCLDSQETDSCEPTQEISYDTVTIAQKKHLEDKTYFGPDQKSTAISMAFAVNETPEHKISGQNAVFSPRKSVEVSSAPHIIKTASKVIKHDPLRTLIDRKPEPAQKVMQQTRIEEDKNNQPERRETAQIQAPTFKEPVITPDEVINSRELLHVEDTDEIDIEPAPAPKVVVKRTMKHYEELQKETDPEKTTLAGHTLIL